MVVAALIYNAVMVAMIAVVCRVQASTPGEHELVDEEDLQW